VRELDKRYIEEEFKRADKPTSCVIDIDEISVKKRNTYRIVVGDPGGRRPIRLRGDDRSGRSMDEFLSFLGEESSKHIAVAVMDI